MRLLSILVAMLSIAAGTAAAQGYTATPITSANSPIFFANFIDLNNKGQVLGDACIANCGVNRFPAVWSNGNFQALPIPTGYIYIANGLYKLNDSGTVVGTVQEASCSGFQCIPPTDVVVWQDGTPTVIRPPANLFTGCTGAASSGSYALNSAGHILISTFYPSSAGIPGPCYAFWVYPGNSIVPFPMPPQCIGVGPGGHPLTYDATPQKAMNDADQVVANILNSYCGPPYVNPAPTTTYDPAVIQPGGSFSFLPASGFTFGGGSGARAAEINNLGNVHGFEDGGVVIWDSNGAHLLGPAPSGYASLNNVGQVLYAYGLVTVPTNRFAIWQNGVSTSIQVPPGVYPAGGNGGPFLNDAGQFTATDGANGRVLVSPSGACGQDVSPQTQVTRGGFRYNHTGARFSQAVTVTNGGGSSITGPISLAFDKLPATATLFGISGVTQCLPPQGSQFINLGSASLASGDSVSATLQFINTEKSGVSYQPRIITGSARR